MGILIQGGRIVDAATDTDKKGDIYLEDGVITEIGEKLKIKDKSDKVIDAKGCLVMPGLIDLHVHFRDPGQTGLRHLREIKITINRRNAGFFMSNFIYFYVVRSCILSLYVI